VLLKFGQLQHLVPAGAVIKQALMNLTFVNWDPYNTYTLKVRLVWVCVRGGGGGCGPFSWPPAFLQSTLDS